MHQKRVGENAVVLQREKEKERGPVLYNPTNQQPKSQGPWNKGFVYLGRWVADLTREREREGGVLLPSKGNQTQKRIVVSEGGREMHG